MDRIDHIQVVVVVTTFNAKGQIINQRPAEPVVLYRVLTPDVWSHLDALLARSGVQAAAIAKAKN